MHQPNSAIKNIIYFISLSIFIAMGFFVASFAYTASNDRYWVGGCTDATWKCNNAGFTNWAISSGGLNNAPVPTYNNDVIFDGATQLGNSASTISQSIAIHSLTIKPKYTAQLTHNANVMLDINGNLQLDPATNYVLVSPTSSAISFTSTTGTESNPTTINTGGKTLGDVTIDGSDGYFALYGDLTISGSFSKSNGTFYTYKENGISDKTYYKMIFTGTGNHTITSGGSAFSNLIQNGTGTYALQDDLTVSGNLTINAGKFDPGINKVTLAGVGSLTSGGSIFYNLIQNGAGTYDLQDNLTVVNNLTIAKGTLNTNDKNIIGKPVLQIEGGIFSGSSGAVNAGDVTISSGTLNAPSGEFKVSGNWKNSGGNFNSGAGGMTYGGTSSTVTLTGTGTHNITSGGSSFNNLTQNGAGGTYTLQDNTTVNNILTITSGNFDAGSTTLTLAGNLGTPFVNSNSGTFIPSTSTVLYTGNNTSAIINSGNTTITNVPYYHLTLNNAGETYMLSGDTTLSGDLTITAGKLDVSPSSFTLTVGGNWTNKVLSTTNWQETKFNENTSNNNLQTVSFSGDGKQVIAGIISGDLTQITNGTDGGHLYISSDSGVSWTATWPAGNNVYKNWRTASSNYNGLRLIAGVAGGRLYISENHGTSWTETWPAGNIGKNWQTTSSDFKGLRLLAGSQSNGNVGTGRLYISSLSDQTCNIDSGKTQGTCSQSKNACHLDFDCTWAETGPAPFSDKYWQTTSSDSAGKNLIAGSYYTYNPGTGRLYISSDFGKIWTETGPKDSNGNFSDKYWQTTASSSDGSRLIAGVGGGRLYIGIKNLTNGTVSWSETGPNIGTDKNWRTASSSVDGKQLLAGNTEALYISSDSGDHWTKVQFEGNVNNSWRVSSSSADGKQLIAGNYDSGNYNSHLYINYSGNFIYRNGTVKLNGLKQLITGSTTFYNLTKSVVQNDTLAFEAGSTQTINPGGTLTLQGTSGRLLLLRSNSNSTKWKLAVNGSASVNYVDVKDSDASGGATINATHSTSSGNNLNWTFNEFNNVLRFTADPSDNGVYTDPTNVGSKIYFTANAVDPNANDYYLAICKENKINVSSNAPPTCTGKGNWCVSNATASGVESSCDYKTEALDKESNEWYAFVCNKNSDDPSCSPSSQGNPISINNDSPFKVNHAPVFTSIGDISGYKKTGDIINFTTVASDPDTSDKVTLYVCKSNVFADCVREERNRWCPPSSASSNPSCAYTVKSSDADGDQNYYGYIIDSHIFAASSNPKSSIFKIDNTPPTTTDNYVDRDNNSQSKAQEITLDRSDGDGSGVFSTKYCTDTVNACDPANGIDYTGKVTISAQGTTYFRYQSIDNVGNIQAIVSRMVIISAFAPTSAKYWVGGCRNTDVSASVNANWDCVIANPISGVQITNWSNSLGGLNTAPIPTASDNVVFDGGTATSDCSGTTQGGNGPSVISNDITIHSLTITSCYTNTLTHNAGQTLTINGNNFDLGGGTGFTYALGNPTTSAIAFIAPTGNTTINTNGKTLGSVIINGQGGTFALAGNVTVSGDWLKLNGTFAPGRNTVNLVGTGSQIIQSRGAGSSSFYNLTQNGPGGTYTLQDNLIVANDIKLVAGTLDVSASNCNNASCNITVGGNWINNWQEIGPTPLSDKTWQTISSSSDGKHLIAGYRAQYTFNGEPLPNTGRLYTSFDHGKTWTETQPPGNVDQKWFATASSSDGKNLIAGSSKACNPFSGKNCSGGRLYIGIKDLVSGTVSWTETQPVKDNPNTTDVDESIVNWTTTASSADGKHLIVGNTSRLYLGTYSSDGVLSWAETGPQPLSDKYWTTTTFNKNSDSFIDGKYLIAGAWGGGLYLSFDSGATWGQTQPAGDSVKDWASVSSSSDGTHLIAGVTAGRLYISSDSGQTCAKATPQSTQKTCSKNSATICSVDADCTTWTETQPVKDNLNTADIDERNNYWKTTASSADGSHLLAGSYYDQIGNSTYGTGRLYTSFDSGATWGQTQPAGDVKRNWYVTSLSADGKQFIAGSYTIGNNPGRLYILSGGFIARNGTVIFNKSAGTQTINALNPIFYNVIHSGVGTLQLSTNGLVIKNDFTNSDGTYDANAKTTTVAGLTTISGGDYQAKTATQIFTGGLKVSGGNFTGSTGNVTSGTVTILSGTLTAPSEEFNVTGSWLQSGGNFTSVTIPSANTVTFIGTRSHIIQSGGTGISKFYNLTQNGAGGTYTLQDNLTVANNLTLVAGTLDAGNNYNINVGGNWTGSGDWAETRPTKKDEDQNWYATASSSDGTKLLAGVYGGRLYASSNASLSWIETGPKDSNGNFSDKYWYTASSSTNGKQLIAGTYYNGEKNSGRLYTYSDSTKTWAETRPTEKDEDKYWYTTSSSADGTRLIAGAYLGRLYIGVKDLADGTISWTETQPAGDIDRNWYATATSDDGKQLMAGALNGRLYIGTYSSDGVLSWHETWPAGNANKYWQTISSSADGKYLIAGVYSGRLYISSPPLDLSEPGQICNGVTKTKPGTCSQSGNACSFDFDCTWKETRPAGDVNQRWQTTSSTADGKQMIAGILNGRLYISYDSGITWIETKPAEGVDKYWQTTSFSSDGSRLIAGMAFGRLYASPVVNFIPQKGTVNLKGGNQSIIGSTKFYNLAKSANTKSTLTFKAKSIQTILPGGSLQLHGSDGKILALRSSNPGIQSEIRVRGTSSASYLDVQDSDASGGNTIYSTESIDSGNNLNWDLFQAPSFVANKGPSDGGSSSATPTNVGNIVKFSATATDAQGDPYYLAICKTNAITPKNGLAPICPGGSWCISDSDPTTPGLDATPSLGDKTEASCTYTAQPSDSQSNNWFAFVCDENSRSKCSIKPSQGSGPKDSPFNSPFNTNHIPTFTDIANTPTDIANTSGWIKVDSGVTFSATAYDLHLVGDPYKETLYVCKSDDFTACKANLKDRWCVSPSIFNNPTCDYTVLPGDGDGSQTYYGYIVDDHGFQASANPKSSTFKTDVTPPTTNDDYETRNDIWQRVDQTITLTPFDASSGVASTKYCINSENTCDPGEGKDYERPVSFYGETNLYFRYQSIDNVGNKQDTVSRNIRIDYTPSVSDDFPPIVDAGPDQVKNSDFTQRGSAADPVSGIASVQWSQTSGPGNVTFNPTDKQITDISDVTDGAYVLRLTATDRAGNIGFDEFTLCFGVTSGCGQKTPINLSDLTLPVIAIVLIVGISLVLAVLF